MFFFVCVKRIGKPGFKKKVKNWNFWISRYIWLSHLKEATFTGKKLYLLAKYWKKEQESQDESTKEVEKRKLNQKYELTLDEY